MSDLGFPPLTSNQLAQMGRVDIQENAAIEPTSNSIEQVAQVEHVEHVEPVVSVVPVVVPQVSTTGVVNPYAPKIAVEGTAQVSAPVPAQVVVPAQSLPYEAVVAEAEEPITSQLPLFAVSPNLNIEPQTASIIIDNFEPLDNISIAISETGEMLKTGSIELPNLSTNTGEIATILDAAQVDEAIAQDSVAGYVSTIAPLRASGVVNTAGKIGIMPSKKARGEGGGFVALTLSILMVTIGGLVLAAFMLGILK